MTKYKCDDVNYGGMHISVCVCPLSGMVGLDFSMTMVWLVSIHTSYKPVFKKKWKESTRVLLNTQEWEQHEQKVCMNSRR